VPKGGESPSRKSPMTIRDLSSERIALIGVPSSVRSQLPLRTSPTRGRGEIVLFYATSKQELAKRFQELLRRMALGGQIWIAWPRGSGLSLRQVREVAFAEGLSDYGKRDLGPTLACRSFRLSRERSPRRPTPPIESEVEVKPLTPDRWDDFVTLMGSRGPTKSCWCMAYRLPHKEFSEGSGQSNCSAMKTVVDGGAVPGLLAYVGGTPVGWCSVAPRRQYSPSRAIVSTADEEDWLIPCFFVVSRYRRRGVASVLLGGAVSYVRSRGGRSIFGVPAAPRGGRSVAGHRGSARTFEQEGFREVGRPSAGSVMMRLDLAKRTRTT
jgi:GNAT superfamily N-acetyltransferase